MLVVTIERLLIGIVHRCRATALNIDLIEIATE